MACLPEIIAFIDDACEALNVDPENCFELRLSLEEICTNIIKHGYRGGSELPIEVALHREDRALRLTITDAAPHFDPRSAPTPELEAGWEERPIGGLGWHLVFEMMDEVQHQPLEPVGNRITLRKTIS